MNQSDPASSPPDGDDSTAAQIARDRHLAADCRRGAEAAVRRFVQQFQGDVFGLCLTMLRHRHDAEDVSQESLIRAIRHLDQWDGRRPLKPWVMTIAANRCRTALSRRKRNQSLSMEEQLLPGVVAGPAVELAEELERALLVLKDEYRTAFVLFHRQHLSCQEIAEVLNCPVNTIKTWLHRARQALMQELKSRDVLPNVRQTDRSSSRDE